MNERTEARSASYNSEIEKELEKKSIKVWDRIEVNNIHGILMPKSSGSKDTLIVKIDNGYNVGIVFNKNINKISGEKQPVDKKLKIDKYKKVEGLPTISIITTGGTVASRIDYNTGATHALNTAEEIAAAIPELQKAANIRLIPAFQMWSEDMEYYHWVKLAERIKQEIDEVQPDGIIVIHGTDIIHYTTAALSLMLQDLPVPVLVVGSQRSSDRASSDAAMNMICAVNFMTKTDFSGVAVCMHANMNDDFCHVQEGTHIRKMHTSRRDTFKSINVIPYAKVYYNGTVEFLRNDYCKKDKNRKINIITKFDKNIALVKMYPGFDYKIIENLAANGVRGIVLEGSGFGNFPINPIDDFTKYHQKLADLFSSVSKNVLLIMTSQAINGNPNLNVYSTGRIEQKLGIVPVDMTPETAFVKLGWVLGQTNDIEKAKEMMLNNYVGEISERIDPRAF
ncbi:MAG TPA: Glu-tRNA(Gln) amidotransferase subunit GatD [archaeon]|nr:Glu-tRNA(Gln) amidotransferase subunit GatD [archaeon]